MIQRKQYRIVYKKFCRLLNAEFTIGKKAKYVEADMYGVL